VGVENGVTADPLKAPPDERGGNRHGRPNTTAPHPDSTCIIRRHSRRLSRGTRNELWSRLKLQEPVERHTYSRTEYCRAEAGADGLRQSDRVGLGRGDEPSAGGREILLRRNGSAEFASTPIAPRRALEHLRVVPTLLRKQKRDFVINLPQSLSLTLRCA
jgi:hypothetical protein